MDSFIARVGGKKLLRKTICDAFPPPDTYNRYIEVFGGAAWVLFYKERHANLEVYNDIDGDLVNLMRCVKYHKAELIRELQGYFNAREILQDILSRGNGKGFTDIQRAAMYFVRVRISFGADGRTFSCSNNHLKGAIKKILAASERLMGNGVCVENQDFERLIQHYDRDKALFYCDPPYYQAEGHYKDYDPTIVFAEADHIRLFEALKNIKGQFLLSYNDCDFVRRLYAGYRMVEVERDNNLGKGRYKELLIANYEVDGE